MSNNKITPLPLRDFGHSIYNANEDLIATVINGANDDAPDIAAFIVKACNMHDELVEALEGYEEAVIDVLSAFIHLIPDESAKRRGEAVSMLRRAKERGIEVLARAKEA